MGIRDNLNAAGGKMQEYEKKDTSIPKATSAKEKIAAEGRAAKINNINYQINELKKEILKIKEEIQEYEIMNGQIASVIGILQNASSDASTSEGMLQNAYTGGSIKDEVSKFDNVVSQIEGIAASLSNVSNESQIIIKEKTLLIEDKQEEINHLYSILAAI